MIIHNLRSIRVIVQTLLHQQNSHKQRNKRLAVLERTIEELVSRHGEWIGADNWLTHKSDLREQLVDGLRSLLLLTHQSLNNEDLVQFETHSDVKDRLRLMEEIASFLIEKAEEAQDGPHVAINQDPNAIPF